MAKIITEGNLISQIMAEYLVKGYPIEENNIFGIRNDNKLDEGIWNDVIGYWTEEKIWLAQGTTDPSPYYIVYHPMNKTGTAMMVPGYHEKIWVIDRHGKSQYTALCNRRWKRCEKQQVWRLDKNYHRIDEDGEPKVFAGYFSCNLHRGDKFQPLPKIGPYSGGCQVIQDPNDFDEFMENMINSGQEFFSYMLFEQGDPVVEGIQL